MPPAATFVLSLAIAAVGVVVFVLLALPLPFLLGPMAACLVAGLLGAPLRGSKPVSDGGRNGAVALGRRLWLTSVADSNAKATSSRSRSAGHLKSALDPGMYKPARAAATWLVNRVTSGSIAWNP